MYAYFQYPPPDTLPPEYPTLWIPYPQREHGTNGILPHSPLNRLTDACENITFPQLLLLAVKSSALMFAMNYYLIIFLFGKCEMI